MCNNIDIETMSDQIATKVANILGKEPNLDMSKTAMEDILTRLDKIEIAYKKQGDELLELKRQVNELRGYEISVENKNVNQEQEIETEQPKEPIPFKHPPKKMIFSTGEIYEINRWNMLVQTTIKYLLLYNKFKLEEKFKSYVNTDPYRVSGKDYITPQKVGNYYVELHGSAQNHYDRVTTLLLAHGIDPNSVKYECENVTS